MARQKSREEEAYTYIKYKIETREWLPHEHLKEQDVAKELAMSRTPVRKAFQRLQDERVVQVEPYKGVRILKPQITSKAFQERLEYIELMLNHYLHKLELEEKVIDVENIRESIERLKEVTRERTEEFETRELLFWKSVLAEEKNTYIRSLILESIHESIPRKGIIKKVLQQSRQTKLDHFSRLTEYIEEQNYPYARREVRILLNQLNLNVIQGTI